jgi:predicted Zn-dependent protease
MKHPVLIRQWQVLILLAVMAVSTVGCVVQRNPVSGSQRAYAWTWEQERQLGQEADQQIIAQFGIYDSDGVDAYVNRVAEQVLAESHMRRPDTDAQFRETPFTFRVLDSPVVNAFALPGGYVYVTRGLLSHLDNEAQLAVVLGHEIVHVAARHASRRAFEQQLGQVGLLGGAILGGQVFGGQAAQTILDLGGAATQLLLLRYGRDDEREADERGVEYAALVGYQTEEAAEFFRSLKRIGEAQQQGLPTWLSTHPDPGEREQSMHQLAQRWREQTSMTLVREDEFMSAVNGMVVGENPRQGFVENNRFYHPDLQFHFPVPPGYQVVNQAAQVVMVEPNQRAILGLTISRQNSPQAAAAEFARQQGLNVVEQGPTTSGGNPAYYVLADANTQQGQVRVLSFYVQHRGNVYNFIGYSAAQQFSAYQETFLRTMRGLETLTDQRILAVQPFRMNVRPAPRTAAFREFVPSELPPGMTAQELAIMNQVELNQQIQQGTRLKLPAR